MITIPLRILSGVRLQQRLRSTCRISTESGTWPLLFFTQLTWGFLCISVGRVPYLPVTSLLCVSRDKRNSVSESASSSSPPSSFTHVHRCIGYHNPTWYSLTKSVRLTNLSVYDRRNDVLETTPSPSPPSSLMLVHRRWIGYHNPNWYS